MKNRWPVILLLFAVAAFAQEWQVALPGYQYEFPRDHFSHPGYRTEWWYYTGNLQSAGGHRFGFELTFFREGAHLSKTMLASTDPVWRPSELYLAHLALSDLSGGHFYYKERLNRAGPGLAGFSFEHKRYWNGNWHVQWKPAAGLQELEAVCDQFKLELQLDSQKPAVIQGQNGIVPTGPRPGDAAHYISFTRLQSSGELRLNGQTYAVTGIAWMDHEFFTESADSDFAGWDWFAIQLNDNEELMLYLWRTKSGQISSYSSGTYVDGQGKVQYLDASEFALSPGEVWTSSASGARYPVQWNISVPSLGLRLSERTALKNQELVSQSSISPTYWEGAVTYNGVIHSQPVQGAGYLEMTGYAGVGR